MSHKLFILICCIFLFYGCEKEVDFNMKNEKEKLVVEGFIENGSVPLVKLSKSIGFFDKVDINTILNTYVHDAEVYVSNDSRTIQLKEYAVEIGGYSGYVYTADTSDIDALTFIGQLNQTYRLKIIHDGKTYESSTTIPDLNNGIDSMWSQLPASADIIAEDSTYRNVFFSYNDDPQIGQRVRYFVSINNSMFLPPFYSVYTDDIVNGSTITLQLERGYNKFEDTMDYEYSTLYHLNDTVTLKWSAIDDATYNFYSTLEFSYGSIGNPFAAPVIITSNISNGALGVWAGYASSYHYLIIKE